MPVVRTILGGLGALALAGVAIATFRGAPFPFILLPALGGLILILGALFERVYYKRVAPNAPGSGWVATDERFVDPATGRLVQVHFRPDTGQRAYVDAGAAPPQ
jgi:hypothetical protein